MLIKHMGEEGLSYETFAVVVGTWAATLYNWEKEHPEFLEAKRKAFEANRIFWERIGLAGMAGKIDGFNATVWIFNMKNRHHWRDRIETENKHEVSGTLNLNGPVVDLIEKYESGEAEEDN